MSRTVRLRHDQWYVNREKKWHRKWAGILVWRSRYKTDTLDPAYFDKHWKRVLRCWRDGGFSVAKTNAQVRRMYNAEYRAKARMDFIEQLAKSDEYVMNLTRKAWRWYIY